MTDTVRAVPPSVWGVAVTAILIILTTALYYRCNGRARIKEEVNVGEKVSALLRDLPPIQPKKGRPAIQFKRIEVGGGYCADYLASRDAPEAIPVVIVPAPLQPTHASQITRAALQFHLSGREVYVAIQPGTSGTFAGDLGKRPPAECVSTLLQYLDQKHEKANLYIIGSSVAVLPSIAGNAAVQRVFLVGPTRNQTLNDQLVQIYTARNGGSPAVTPPGELEKLQLRDCFLYNPRDRFAGAGHLLRTTVGEDADALANTTTLSSLVARAWFSEI